MIIKSNSQNGNSEVVEAQRKLAEAKKSEQGREMAAFRETVDSLTGSLEEVADEIKGYRDLMATRKSEKQDYFDKDLGKTITDNIGKVLILLKTFKQQEVKVNIDTSSIAAEIKRGQDSIIALANKFSTSGNAQLEQLLKMVVTNQNNLVERLEKQVDLTPALREISDSIGGERVERLTVTYHPGGAIKEVIPQYKK